MVDNNDYNKKLEGKPNIHKVDPSFIEGMAKVFDYGDKKYGERNYFRYDNVNDLISAIYRHTASVLQGEVTDNGSNLSHLYHIATNCMIIQMMLDSGRVSHKSFYYSNNYRNLSHNNSLFCDSGSDLYSNIEGVNETTEE